MTEKDLAEKLMQSRALLLEDFSKVYRLKDGYGNLWDIQSIIFNRKGCLLCLGNEGTGGTGVLISADGTYDDMEDYKIVRRREDPDWDNGSWCDD